MRDWRDVLSYKTEITIEEIGTRDDIEAPWSGASGAISLQTDYANLVSRFGHGFEGDQGDYPDIYWVIKWSDGTIIEIAEHTKNWDLDEGADPYEALREHGDDWTVWVGDEDDEKSSEIADRLIRLFGKDVVKYYRG
jgi:hypothetical protein